MSETFLQKEKRLKARKQTYRESYKKNAVFIEYSGKDKLIEWLRQENVLIKVQAAGLLDDESEFTQLSIEGFVVNDK